jgi:hypothetical protein
MTTIRAIAREPLLHFIVAGAVLFGLFYWVAPEEAVEFGDDVIVVDRDALLTFIQYRTKAFQPEIAAARFDAMTAEQRQALIDDYVREEALHREAIALGLDSNDYIIKRRLMQKVEFIAQGFVEAGVKIDEAALQDFYEANKDNYFIPPSITFTHVFFDTNRHGPTGAAAAAEAKLGELNANGVPFTDAPKHGDRFPYHLNYVEPTYEFVGSHFGPAMTETLFALSPSETVWRGPYSSSYGSHVVLVTDLVPGRYPPPEEIRTRLESDARQAEMRARTDAAIEAIVARYEVRDISDDGVGAAARASAE